MSAVLEAKDEIRELMAAYAMAMDACHFADVGACFAPDAEWITNYGAARGPAEIANFIAGIVPVKGEGPQRKHYITNIIIKLDGNRAEARSDYLVVRESEGGLMPVMGGTSMDDFAKRDAVWQFARKRLVHDIVGDMALKNKR